MDAQHGKRHCNEKSVRDRSQGVHQSMIYPKLSRATTLCLAIFLTWAAGRPAFADSPPASPQTPVVPVTPASFWERTQYPAGSGFLGLVARTGILSSTSGARIGASVGLADEWIFPAGFAGRAELAFQYYSAPLGSTVGVVPGFGAFSVLVGPRMYLGTSPTYLDLSLGPLFNHANGRGESSPVAFQGFLAFGIRKVHFDLAIAGGIVNDAGVVSLRIVEPGIQIK
jgi:hypothetical protein